MKTEHEPDIVPSQFVLLLNLNVISTMDFALSTINSNQSLQTLDKSVETRLPPHNIEAEQALLAALLHNNLAYEKVSEILMPEYFCHEIHGKVYHAIGHLIERGQVADVITLKNFFERDPILQEIGGAQYLAQLAQSLISVINVRNYAELIHDLYLRRQLINVGEEVINQAFGVALDVPATKQIEGAEQRLFDLATLGHSERGFVKFSKALTLSIASAEIAFKRDSHIVGVTTGLQDVDKWLGGLHPSDLIIIAGRPSMGKTALATNIAFSAAKASLKQMQGGGIVGFFSLEMSAEQLATRLLAQEVRVSSDKIRRGDISHDDFPKFLDVGRMLAELPLYIDDTPALSISGLRTRARRLKRKFGLDLIVIDYLQLLHGSSTGGKSNENRVQEISDITRSLKALAKELDVPVIALSQLSRAVEQREDKRPQLSDLRESGSIEQDADVVTFVFREEYYEARKEPPENTDKHREWQENMNRVHNTAEFIIAKQRHGPIGTIKLYFEGSLTKFGDLDAVQRS
ncbi:MAG: replicative DNA helicase [Janthinobacterium lividum]